MLGSEREGEPGLRFLAEARSQGFFPWGFLFHVDDRKDTKIPQTLFDVGPCALDVLSALFVVRISGVEDARRVPVRMRSKLKLVRCRTDLERYEPGQSAN